MIDSNLQVDVRATGEALRSGLVQRVAWQTHTCHQSSSALP